MSGLLASRRAASTPPQSCCRIPRPKGLPFAPAEGDTFNVAFGCDHTQATCQSKFNNLINFRGFPYVPPPQLAY